VTDVWSPLPQNPTIRFNPESAEPTSYPHRPPDMFPPTPRSAELHLP